jgi:hypothetical protein
MKTLIKIDAAKEREVDSASSRPQQNVEGSLCELGELKSVVDGILVHLQFARSQVTGRDSQMIPRHKF